MTVRRTDERHNHIPFITVGYISWNQTNWWCAHDGECKPYVEVLAWKPLPEPYKGERDMKEEIKNALHCLKVMAEEEVCEECALYGTTGTDHCERDCVRTAIKALEIVQSNSDEDCIGRNDLREETIIVAENEYQKGWNDALEAVKKTHRVFSLKQR